MDDSGPISSPLSPDVETHVVPFQILLLNQPVGVMNFSQKVLSQIRQISNAE